MTYAQNRELSWLRFDERVLTESMDESVPLFERLKFIAIFESNMHEFLMVRMGGLSSLATLKRQPRDNKSGMTPSEQVAAVFSELPGLFSKASTSLDAIESLLRAKGVERMTPAELIGTERDTVRNYFNRNVQPIFSPLIIDPRHPFPNLRNGALYVVCTLASASEDEQGLLGIIEVPTSLPRVIEVSNENGLLRYILLEDIILACLDSCFGAYSPQDSAVIRVTRNADLDPDGEGVEEDEDYRQHMKKVLKKRLRLQPVLLAIHGDLGRDAVKSIRKALHLTQQAVLSVNMPLDLGFIFSLEGRLPAAAREKLLFPPFAPQPSPMFCPGEPMREQVLAGDKLLFYPYESMNTLLDLINEAAHDDARISLRITLYRVARQSRLCESLISAAERGKEVTVLMELRARFDEENNIAWAERLEEAGCTVIYGAEGFKCHSKICQLTYHEQGRIERITLLGTGNFNEKTARLYSDFMLMTAHEGIGEDADTVHLSSADMMTRNTEHRVEIAYPVLDPACRAMVRDYMADQLRDNVKARELDARGRWVPVARAEGEAPFNAQEHLMAQAIERARAAEEKRAQTAAGKELRARAELLESAQPLPSTRACGTSPAKGKIVQSEATVIVPAPQPAEGRFKRGWRMIVSGFKEMLS